MAASCSVFLNVQDIERSMRFYEGLGFRVDKVYRDGTTGAARYADLSFQGAELGLGHIPVSDDPEFRSWVSTPLGAGVVIYYTVPDVDAVFARAKAQGALIEYEPQDRSYGRVFGLNDPDGYVVSFLREPPAARKAAKKATKAVKKAAAGARRRVTTAARKASPKKPPAARSLAATRKQAVKKGAARKSVKTMRRSDKGLGRVR